MWQGILFDKDGTLFDFQATWGAWAMTCLDRLADGDADLLAVLADRLRFDLAGGCFHPDSFVIAGTPEEIVTEIAPVLPDWTPTEILAEINGTAAQAQVQPATDLPALVVALRARGLALGVATNDACAAAHQHLDQAGIGGAFDFVAGYDSGFGGKPAPGMLKAFAAALTLEPASVVMVGDSRHDLLAGRAAGMATLGVLTGVATADELSELADAILPDIGGLPAWLDQTAPRRP